MKEFPGEQLAWNPTGWKGRPPLYPWDKWLNGSVWEIEAGVDFKITSAAMRQRLRMVAKKRGMKIWVEGNSKADKFRFQARQVNED